MVKIDRIIRSNRKSIALIIELDGSVTVRAPQRISYNTVQAFVDSKESWVSRKQQLAQQKILAQNDLERDDIVLWPFLGKEYPLVFSSVAQRDVIFNGGEFIVSGSVEQAKPALETFYRREARRYLTHRVPEIARMVGVKPGKLRITGARRRWGSCNSRGNLSFSWRLILAPAFVVDYVIIHELAHLLIRNHSSEFWRQVETWMPEYQSARVWQRKHGAKLMDLL